MKRRLTLVNRSTTYKQKVKTQEEFAEELEQWIISIEENVERLPKSDDGAREWMFFPRKESDFSIKGVSCQKMHEMWKRKFTFRASRVV